MLNKFYMFIVVVAIIVAAAIIMVGSSWIAHNSKGGVQIGSSYFNALSNVSTMFLQSQDENVSYSGSFIFNRQGFTLPYNFSLYIAKSSGLIRSTLLTETTAKSLLRIQNITGAIGIKSVYVFNGTGTNTCFYTVSSGVNTSYLSGLPPATPTCVYNSSISVEQLLNNLMGMQFGYSPISGISASSLLKQLSTSQLSYASLQTLGNSTYNGEICNNILFNFGPYLNSSVHVLESLKSYECFSNNYGFPLYYNLTSYDVNTSSNTQIGNFSLVFYETGTSYPDINGMLAPP